VSLIDKWAARRRDRSIGGHPIKTPATPGEADAQQLVDRMSLLRQQAANADTMPQWAEEEYKQKKGRN